ncbi:pyrophosphatase, MutT/NUDIX family [Burkholderia pseudomallei]|nr:pyrophosphatase, MutT/NUDIX family [Burkholderia pseudomallei]AJX59773.1 pyrophosphatase, MutT/NUDIX family [Burkholderia pseudomallei Pasteur 52237]KGX18590.1 pyrophosphatase, MutT/NUDIX family [Burkholderia pseudomallei ABCPW 1]KGD17983.1 pyrophosphatase, MutT/NUDIX family [Burkholderia pseudomallei]CAJ2838344.1 pyrophosphatase, MutT/NUDIX family [Burkholderia pseudomallei]
MRVPPRILSSHVSFCDRTSNRATSRTGCLVRDKPAKASRYSEAEQRMRIRRLPSFQRVLSTSERRFKRPGAPSMRRAPCRRGHAGRRLLAENFACGPILGRVHAAAPESASAAWTSIRARRRIRPFAHSHCARRTAHGARPTTHGAAACLRSAGEPRPIAFPHPRHATRPDRRAVPSRGACRARWRRHPASDSPRAFFFSARQYGHIHSEQSLT